MCSRRCRKKRLTRTRCFKRVGLQGIGMVAIFGRFVDRCVVILEGTAGIGLAAARMFAGEGAKIAVTGRDPLDLRIVAEELDALAIGCDLGDPVGCAGAMAEIEEALGGIDVLVVAAEAGQAIPCALPLMRDGGAIVMIGAFQAEAGILAKDLVPRRIRVNAVRPNLAEMEISGDDAQGQPIHFIKDTMAIAVAAAPQAAREKIARAVLFLASCAARGINGIVIGDDDDRIAPHRD
jgi:NAD(P)-dependent dehydrogenase (short-subunit alcohol dehydrogenase family)